MKFKVGDMVSPLIGSLKGKLGIISAIEESWTYPYSVKMPLYGTSTYKKDELILVAEAPSGVAVVATASPSGAAVAALPKFKVGDRVKSLIGVQTGQIGTIKEIKPDWVWPYIVNHPGCQGDFGYEESELTLVATASQAPPPNGKNYAFKTGDQVVADSADEVFIGIEDEMSDSAPLRGKCECGSEKAGSDRHSDWCPKFLFQENTNE